MQNTVNFALKGQVYNPVIGFEPIGAVGGHPKYPFNPYYGGFSPRVSVAWNPRFQNGILQKVFGQGKTVIRAGYARIYDRNNGVDLVLVPLLGYGFGQTIRCSGAGTNGLCNGSSQVNPTNAFRLGIDGNSGPFPAVQQALPIPAEPGINSPAGSNISFLDNNWRPGANNQITLGIQRELPDNTLVEVAYVGKWSTHLYQGLDVNDVPWMMTLGGQSFAQAYATFGKRTTPVKLLSLLSLFLRVLSRDRRTVMGLQTAPPPSWRTKGLAEPETSALKMCMGCTRT